MNNEYNKLDEIAQLLNLDMNNYTEAIELYKKNKDEACLKYLGFEDSDNEINKLEIFFYYYLSENLKCYFHNKNSRFFTNGLKNLTSEYQDILIEKIDFVDFEEKEELYDDILVDLLACCIEYELKKINKSLFGISVGINSCIYLVTDYKTLNQIKNVKSNLIQIFDTINLEKIYGIIFQLKEDDPKFEGYIKKGDYLMQDIAKKGKFTTLFKNNKKANVVFDYLEEDQKKNLKVVL